MSEEEIKERKMEELRQRLEQQQAEEEQKQLAEQRVEILLKKILSPEAKARLKNVKLVNQDAYWAAVQQLIALYQSGRVQGGISEEQVKKMLSLLSRKRDITIKRK